MGSVSVLLCNKKAGLDSSRPSGHFLDIMVDTGFFVSSFFNEQL
ncbi:hypothetical protein [Anaplasma phagocytophilum]|uniref:Uncharacterized protein n=1 Tax=Anaplasma phagocytophilum str. CRT53-1 TaxID=1359157 RepID=A0A0F3Q5Q7_ANAPH|nr:hypothetical protein [Anaplasma phagocytophilum]KJV87557.1 hypothetical protein APHCRT_0347 [Anaplasma phagocytophilum str. CRT53-1]